MKSNLLMWLAIITVAAAFMNASVTLLKSSEIKGKITGQAFGFVNLSVQTVLSINISRDTVNWGPGRVNGTGDERFNATLYTSGETSTVLRGNWSKTNVKGIVIQNLGNVNFSLTLLADRNETELFGPGATNRLFWWNVSNKDLGTCSGGGPLGVWAKVNVSAEHTFCTQFSYFDASNEIYLDTWLTVPYDANTTNTPLGVVITATASAA